MNYKWLQKPPVFDTALNYGPKREGAISLQLNGKGYIGFGNPEGTNDSTNPNFAQRIADLMEYNPSQNGGTWKLLWKGNHRGTPTTPGGRQYGFAFGIGSFIYVGGGVTYYTDLPSGWLTDFWRINPSRHPLLWERLPDLPFVGRNLCIGFNSSQKGYVGLGAIEATAPPGYANLSDVWEFNPAIHVNNGWIKLADYPNGINSAVGFCINDSPYIGTGNFGDGSATNQFFEYNGNSWVQKENIPVNLSGAVGFACNNKGYIGLGSGAPSNLYEYTPPHWNAIIPTNEIPMRGKAVGFGLGNQIYVGTGFRSPNDYFNDFWELVPVTVNHGNGGTTPPYTHGSCMYEGREYNVGDIIQRGGGDREQCLVNISTGEKTWVPYPVPGNLEYLYTTDPSSHPPLPKIDKKN